VVVSDNMEMDAISSSNGTARGAVEAIKAGVDMIIVSHQQDLQREVIAAVSEAVKQGEISEARFKEAIEIIRLSNPPTDTEIDHVLAQAVSYKKIIVGTVTSSPCSQQLSLHYKWRQKRYMV
jgi:H2-forming N5,N10-methylenetetrahydromethanopterin dehydrogenase-like enzyme